MLRCWLGEVGECRGNGIWRTERGVGIGSVETDMPLSFAEGRLGEAVPDGSMLACEVDLLSFCFDTPPLFAIVCRIFNCGVLDAREG